MSAYRIVFPPAARRQLAALDATARRRVARRIEALATEPRPPGGEVLKGGQGELRVRVGDWRVIYAVRDRELLVLVIKTGYRSDVYREP